MIFEDDDLRRFPLASPIYLHRYEVRIYSDHDLMFSALIRHNTSADGCSGFDII